MATILLGLALFVVCVTGQILEEAQHACYSRFDYEYKVLSKLVQLESTIGGQADVIQHLQTTISNQADVIKGLTAKTEELTDDLDHHKNMSGTVYTRWGRTSCPGNGTEFVYDGYVAGSNNIHTGAAANTLCLPRDPDWGHYQGNSSEFVALVYGVEYQRSQEFPNYMSYFPNSDQSTQLHDRDVPCAVCRSPRASVVMVPAKNQCNEGWSLEYEGYLMAGRYTHLAATEYVCVDGAPEPLPGGEADQNGKLFYMVEARCGSLKCPPYVNGQKLTCAVCSK